MLAKSELIVIQALIASASLTQLRRARKALEVVPLPGNALTRRNALHRLDACIAFRLELDGRESVPEL